MKVSFIRTLVGLLIAIVLWVTPGRAQTVTGAVTGTVTDWIAEPGLPQVASNQIVDQSSRAQQMVSKNQLLTPEKALKATARAREDLLRGREESARKEIQRALDISPPCASTLALQGIVQYQDMDYAEASRAFQRSIDEDPTLGAAYLGLGDVFIIQSRFREALIPLDRAVYSCRTLGFRTIRRR
jgi:tetratricopeptide (TPR) repeat protein